MSHFGFEPTTLTHMAINSSFLQYITVQYKRVQYSTDSTHSQVLQSRDNIMQLVQCNVSLPSPPGAVKGDQNWQLNCSTPIPARSVRNGTGGGGRLKPVAIPPAAVPSANRTSTSPPRTGGEGVMPQPSRTPHPDCRQADPRHVDLQLRLSYCLTWWPPSSKWPRRRRRLPRSIDGRRPVPPTHYRQHAGS